MRHRALRRNLLYLKGDGVGLVSPDPDRQHCLAIHIFKNNDGGATIRVHHQSANLNFDFHSVTSPITLSETVSLTTNHPEQAIRFRSSYPDSHFLPDQRNISRE